MRHGILSVLRASGMQSMFQAARTKLHDPRVMVYASWFMVALGKPAGTDKQFGQQRAACYSFPGVLQLGIQQIGVFFAVEPIA